MNRCFPYDRLVLVLVKLVEHDLLGPPQLDVAELLALADDVQQSGKLFVTGGRGKMLHRLKFDVISAKYRWAYYTNNQLLYVVIPFHRLIISVLLIYFPSEAKSAKNNISGNEM